MLTELGIKFNIFKNAKGTSCTKCLDIKAWCDVANAENIDIGIHVTQIALKCFYISLVLSAPLCNKSELGQNPELALRGGSTMCGKGNRHWVEVLFTSSHAFQVVLAAAECSPHAPLPIWVCQQSNCTTLCFH